MNKLQPSNPYIHLQQKTQLTLFQHVIVHTNRKISTFFVTATYSLAPPNVNTFPIYNHSTGVGVQLEL